MSISLFGVLFAVILVLSPMWNDLFWGCVDEVSTWQHFFDFFQLTSKPLIPINSRVVSDDGKNTKKRFQIMSSFDVPSSLTASLRSNNGDISNLHIQWAVKMSSARAARPARAFFILTHLIDVIYETTTWIWNPVVDVSTELLRFVFFPQFPIRSC